MKLIDPANPVRATWFEDQGWRLDAKPYVSETYSARMTMKRLPHTETLGDLTERIFRPGIFKRHWTNSEEYGVPFLSSADIFEADLSSLPMITKKLFDRDPSLPLQPGWTLITCSGMTAGRVTYARKEMTGYACTQDVLRVVPTEGILAGYLYTFLASRYGTAMIRGGVYGTSIKHIEPPHLANIPVPRLGKEIEGKINSLITEAMEKRSRYQEGIVCSTATLLRCTELSYLLDENWHAVRDTGFTVSGLNSASLRALNFSPRAQSLINDVKSTDYITLGEVCENGTLRTGARFKRIESDSNSGVRLIGQRQVFWMRPEGRWINQKQAPADIIQKDETVLVAAHGTLGENEVYAKAVFITGRSLSSAYSQDFLRINPGPSSPITGPYLFAFLRSNIAFRILRSMSVGGKQQEYHPALLRDLPIPLCGKKDQDRITEMVRRAYRCRDEADALEDEAMALLETAIREAAV